ncbi:SLC13 family permease [Haloferula chungangensis]|uniref:SLC13 family permease n=1 Tax=Haloferula chungangensis TaxID=1048331 RepID=A0ABW2L2V0_9BACT
MSALKSLLSGKTISLILAFIGFLLPFFIQIEGLSEAGHRLLSIFIFAVVLWVSEAIPLFATSACVILLLILFLSDVSADLGWAWGVAEGFGEEGPPRYKVFFDTLANQVLILFLGGFFLAFGAAKFGVDRNLAAIMLKPFGSKPSRVLLGLMLITGVLSMWMSNTATTATIMAVVLPIIHRLDADDKLRAGLAIGIPFAANIGGIGTPIGTPPNAIILGALAKINPETGQPVGQCSFLQWMIFAVPLAMLLLLLAWVMVLLLFPASKKSIEIDMNVKWVKSSKAAIYYATAVFTILMWITGSLHGINSYVVGMFPVAILLATGVVGSKEFRMLEWDVLWLVAGGIALGVGVSATSFDAWIVGLIDWNAMNVGLVGIAICGTALLMSTFISNSAASNLLAPIAIAVASAAGGNVVIILVFVAIGASLAMALPISTPPNAIAYGAGIISTKQMATSGIIVAVVGVGLTYLLLPVLLKMAGLG